MATAADLLVAERRARAVELVKAGATYRDIAAHLKVSLRTAWKDVQRELERLAAETQHTTAIYRSLELQRLDRLQVALWNKALGGKREDGTVIAPDVGAVHAILKIMERRARLLGLDAPQQVEVGGSMEVIQTFQQAQSSLAAKLANLPVIDVTPQLAALSTGGDNGNGHH